MVDQAAEAVRAGLNAGLLRQTVFFLLPVNEKEADFNSTEPVDYPCSLQKVNSSAGRHQWKGWSPAEGMLPGGLPAVFGVWGGGMCNQRPEVAKTRASGPPPAPDSNPKTLAGGLLLSQPVPSPPPLLQEFDTACALTKSLLQRLLGAAAAIQAKRIDDGGVEGEPCAGGRPQGGWGGGCRRTLAPRAEGCPGPAQAGSQPHAQTRMLLHHNRDHMQ